MSEKYLPIGSICTLKGKHKKVMVTGYYSVEFNGNLKINDYQGCAYPEGLLLPEFTCTFNHSDIEQVDFLGYKNEEYDKFSSLLNRLTGNESSGTSSNNDWVLTSNNTYSKLLFDVNGVVVLAEPAIEKKEEKVSEFKEVEAIKLENPFKKEYEEEILTNVNNDIFKEEKVEENNSNTSNTIYRFDENGFVVAVEENTSANAESVIEPTHAGSVYKFDENGTVIGVEESTEVNETPESELKPSNPIYRFDENGFVVAVENQ